MGFHDNSGKYHPFRKSILLSLNDFREVTSGGDVGNIVANGGLLASDTTPILEGDAAETQQINWASSNSDILACQIALPADFQGKDDVIVELDVASGTTDAATFTVETGWNAGALVSDTATDGNKSATVHRITATVSHKDIPDAATYLTLILTPGAHTTNAILLHRVALTYVCQTQ